MVQEDWERYNMYVVNILNLSFFSSKHKEGGAICKTVRNDLCVPASLHELLTEQELAE